MSAPVAQDSPEIRPLLRRPGALIAPLDPLPSGVPHSDGGNPTITLYASVVAAHAFLNNRLFAGRLSEPIITLQRRGRRYLGHFAGWQFATHDGTREVHELSLNPRYLCTLPIRRVLAILGHEMVHAEQSEYGRAPRHGYHDRQFAAWMRRIGLITSATGLPGGRPCGDTMNQYAESGGPFERACDDLLSTGFTFVWGDRLAPVERLSAARNKKRYRCPRCHIIAYGKPRLHLICGVCTVTMMTIEHLP
jgi:hypothetical protein